MTKQSIAIVGIIIIAIVLGRLLLKRMESESEKIELRPQVMYLTDSASVRIVPDEFSEVLYKLFEGDSVLISEYNDEWKELQSGGFLPANVLVEFRQ